MAEQCKQPIRFNGKNFNGILYCTASKGHDGLHYYSESAQ